MKTDLCPHQELQKSNSANPEDGSRKSLIKDLETKARGRQGPSLILRVQSGLSRVDLTLLSPKVHVAVIRMAPEFILENAGAVY